METRIAKIISYVLHPLLMPTYGTVLLFYINSNSFFYATTSLVAVVTSLVFVSTFLMPIIASALMLKNKYVKSIQLNEKDERRLPLVIASIFFLSNYYLLNSIPMIGWIKIFLLGSCVSVVLTLIINLFWKVSAHAIGIAGVVGAVIGLSLRIHYNLSPLIIMLISLFGLVGFARLKLLAHTPSQVYVGFLVGFASEITLYLLF